MAAVLVLAGVVGGVVYAFAGGDAAAAGDVCKIQTFKAQPQRHVTKLPKGFEYNSFPPSSGPHHPQTVVYGEYGQPVPTLSLVHNLEHGAVAIQYGRDVPERIIRELVGWYRNDPRGIIVAPLPDTKKSAGLAGKITLAAWVAEREDDGDPRSRIEKQEGKLAICSRFDADEFNAFLESYRARGPELFTLDQMSPGSN